MKICSKRIAALLAALTATACGATILTSETKPEQHDPTGIERLEQEAEDEEVADIGDEPEEPEGSMGVVLDEDDTQESSDDETQAEKRSLSAEGDSVWASGSAETVADRARRQLRRRCDTGSKPACRALPEIDRCTNDRRHRSCAKLGKLYAEGADGVTRNPEHARDFWMKACDLVPAECIRHGQTLFDTDGLDGKEAAAEHLFRSGCTRQFNLCARVGRFYERKEKMALARKFFDLGCSGGQQDACRSKEKIPAGSSAKR